MSEEILELKEKIDLREKIVQGLNEQLNVIKANNEEISQAIRSTNDDCTSIRNETAEVRPYFEMNLLSRQKKIDEIFS